MIQDTNQLPLQGIFVLHDISPYLFLSSIVFVTKIDVII